MSLGRQDHEAIVAIFNDAWSASSDEDRSFRRCEEYIAWRVIRGLQTPGTEPFSSHFVKAFRAAAGRWRIDDLLRVRLRISQPPMNVVDTSWDWSTEIVIEMSSPMFELLLNRRCVEVAVPLRYAGQRSPERLDALREAAAHLQVSCSSCGGEVRPLTAGLPGVLYLCERCSSGKVALENLIANLRGIGAAMFLRMAAALSLRPQHALTNYLDLHHTWCVEHGHTHARECHPCAFQRLRVSEAVDVLVQLCLTSSRVLWESLDDWQKRTLLLELDPGQERHHDEPANERFALLELT